MIVIGGHSKVVAIAPLKKADNHVLVATEDQYVVFDLQKHSIIDTLASKKKGGIVPTLINVSPSDNFSVESNSHAVYLRNL